MIEPLHEFESQTGTGIFARLPRPFWTEREGRLLTVGTAFLTTPESNFGRLAAAKLEALAFFRAGSRAGACAEGKLVFADAATNTVTVYQCGLGTACRVGCGNANAAGIVLLAQHAGTAELTIQMRMCRHLVAAQAEVRPFRYGFAVRQRWFLPQCPKVAATTLPSGQRVLRVTGALNPYVLVEGTPDFDPRPLFAQILGDTSLRARGAVIARTGGLPMVRFYNADRPHGAAPQTGLATLAIAARLTPWVARLFAEGAISHPLGVEPLPEVLLRGKGVAITMPMVNVTLGCLSESSPISQ